MSSVGKFASVSWGHRGDVRADGDGNRAERLRQEGRLEIVRQGRRGHVGDHVARSVLREVLAELVPVHIGGDAVEDLGGVPDLFHHRRQPRQLGLGPDHLLARAPPNPVNVPDPDFAIGRRGIDE